MVLTAGALLGGAAIAAGTILKLEEENALTNGGSYLINGQPRDFTGKVGQQLARRACQAYGNNPSAVPESKAFRYENACRPYLDTIGAGSGPKVDAGWEGGLCAGVVYNLRGTVTGETRTCPNNLNPLPVDSPYSSTVSLIGPITGVTESPQLGACSALGPQGMNIIVTHSGPSSPSTITAVTFGTARYYSSINVSKQFVRADGSPDTCGDPPPVVTQPQPDPTPTPTKRPLVIAPQVNINADVTINNIGAIVFKLGVDDIEIDPFDDDGAAGGGGPAPGDVGEPGTGLETGAGDEVDGEAPPGKVVVGVRLALETIPGFREPLDNQVYKGPGYVYFGTADGLALNMEGALVRDSQFFFAPKDNLTRWAVRANVGWNIRVTPYYREAE